MKTKNETDTNRLVNYFAEKRRNEWIRSMPLWKQCLLLAGTFCVLVVALLIKTAPFILAIIGIFWLWNHW